MTTLHFENFLTCDVQISYNKSYSRPSKSLLTPELYNLFKCIKDTNILPNLSPEDLIHECTNYVYDTHTLFEENILIQDKNFHMIHVFTFADIVEEMRNSKRKNFAIIFKEMYTYPKIQFMYILSKYFDKNLLSTSQFYNFGILFCENLINDDFLSINKDTNVKDFNVKIPDYVLNCIKKYNDYIFKRIININEILIDMCYSIKSVQIINEEINLLSKYYKMYISRHLFTNCNNCKLIYSSFLDCCICQKCYSLYL
jgi:hypothetical protein